MVVYSVFDSDQTQLAARQAGAAAFVPKSGPPDHLRAAVLAAWQAAQHHPLIRQRHYERPSSVARLG